MRSSSVPAALIAVGTSLVMACGSDVSSSGTFGRSGGGGAGFGGTGFPAGGSGGISAPIGGGPHTLPTDPSADGEPLPSTSSAPPFNPYMPDLCPDSSYGVGAWCLQYFACAIGCRSDADCPDAGSGTALAECVSDAFQQPTCVLGCGESAVCPDGMVCVITGHAELGNVCLWPTATGLYPCG